MRIGFAAFLLLSSSAGASAQSAPAPVTLDNFPRAESDMYFRNAVKDAGGTGKLFHHREPMSIDHQSVIRPNRDTLYSLALIDLDAGPVTVTFPEAGKRFMSLQPINEDHYVVGDVRYGAGSYTYDRQQAGTRYLLFGIRTLVDPNDAKDVAEVHALQDAIKLEQASTGSFDAPDWDPKSQKEIRDALLLLNKHSGSFARAFGTKDEVDPIRHLLGSAAAWGGNPDKDATYLNVTPPDNDGKTPYRLTVKDVPVDGFWSISLYNPQGYFQKNTFDAYSLNNITAKKESDGTVNVQFGDCDGKIANCLPIMPGWNYTVRLYEPRAEILAGSWTFPQPQPLTDQGRASAK